MKTLKLSKLVLLLFAATALLLASCDKEKNTEVVDTKSLQSLSADEAEVQNVNEEASNDVDAVLAGGAGLKNGGMPCNVTVDTAQIIGDTLYVYLTYNGENCNGTRIREGQIVVKKKVGTFWGQEGAQVVVDFIDFKVTRVATGKSVTLNGTKIFTNVTGGGLRLLGHLYTSIVHRETGFLEATINDSLTRTWNMALQKTYTGALGTLEVTLAGIGSADGYDNLAWWGTNRANEQFYTSIIEPVVHRQTCGFDPVSGKKFHNIPSDNKNATITFGYDANGNLVGEGDCPTHFRLDWVKGINSGTLYLPLH